MSEQVETTSDAPLPKTADDDASEATPRAEAAPQADAAQPPTLLDGPAHAADAGSPGITAREVNDEPAAGTTADDSAAVDSAGVEPSPAGATEMATGPDAAGASAAKPPASPAPEEPEAVRALRKKKNSRQEVEGRVIGWNAGGFHVVVDGVTAFCPRSEMEVGPPAEPSSYLDQDLSFQILKIREQGRRIVLSRSAVLRAQQARLAAETRQKLEVGSVVEGVVVSLPEFGAFVDLGGVKGLVHVSEISRNRIQRPSEVLTEGQKVQVKILKIEEDGARISLSMRSLEPDPWRDAASRFGEGSVVVGTVERTAGFGAFIELEPGLTGLLPASAMSLPADTSPARAYPQGRQVEVQITAIDVRRRRISLAPKGTGAEGSKSDFEEYKRTQKRSESSSFNALAAAFEKIERS